MHARTRLAAILAALALAGAALAPVARAQDPAAAQAPGDAAEADRLEKEIESLANDGHYAIALPLAERALEIRARVLPAGDVRIASSTGDLGALLLGIGDLVRAEALLQKAVALAEKAKPDGKEHATALGNLATLHSARGERDKARGLKERAFAMLEKALGPDHTDVGTLARSLGQLAAAGDPKRGEALVRRALAIHEKAKAEREAIADLTVLGFIVREQGRAEGLKYYQDALARSDKLGGAASKLQGAALRRSIAVFIRREASSAGSPEATERFRKDADRYFAEAERGFVDTLGDKHASVADLYADWALNAQAAGDLERAVALRRKSNDIDEANLAHVLGSGSEAVKKAYLDKLARHAEDTVSMHLWERGKDSAGAARLALETILRRKGRVLDALAGDLALLRGRVGAGERAVVDALATVRAELSTLAIRGPGDGDPAAYRSRLGALEGRASALEAKVSEASAPFRAAARPVTLDAVQAAIPEDAALVEIVRYTPRDARAFSAAADRRDERYAAYVVRRSGPVKFTILETVGTIDTVVQQLRKGLSDPARRDVGDPAWRLYALTFARFRALLGDAKHVLIAPDGALNLVPFAALIDDKKFLAERWALSYLSSGRDLLRFDSAAKSRGAAVLVADPAYDAAGSTAAPAGKDRAGDLSRAKFSPLPGTADEAKAIGGVLDGARVLVRSEATERALKGVSGPEVLHVATHGFFLAREAGRDRGGSRGLELEAAPAARPTEPAAAGAPPPSPPRPRYVIASPLLRSGLALAGANVRREDPVDDGILTALEASHLDLFGTKLVVLSACETGLGETSTGEGVYGLRRALVLAGSQSQVMSLWKVDDLATRDLMTDYYKRLVAGEGRAAALRAVQLSMISRKETAHPYFWAAFIVSGNPGPIREATTGGGAKSSGAGGKPGEVPKVEPGARGCGCTVPAPDGEIGALAALSLAALLACVRSRLRRGPSTSRCSRCRRRGSR